MRIIFIGDIHGRSQWKSILRKEEDAEIAVFFGDYFDSKEGIEGGEQLQNFWDIIEAKKEREKLGKKVVLLFGNHDYHYMPWHTREPYSGFTEEFKEPFRTKMCCVLMPEFHRFGWIEISEANSKAANPYLDPSEVPQRKQFRYPRRNGCTSGGTYPGKECS